MDYIEKNDGSNKKLTNAHIDVEKNVIHNDYQHRCAKVHIHMTTSTCSINSVVL